MNLCNSIDPWGQGHRTKKSGCLTRNSAKVQIAPQQQNQRHLLHFCVRSCVAVGWGSVPSSSDPSSFLWTRPCSSFKKKKKYVGPWGHEYGSTQTQKLRILRICNNTPHPFRFLSHPDLDCSVGQPSKFHPSEEQTLLSQNTHQLRSGYSSTRGKSCSCTEELIQTEVAYLVLWNESCKPETAVADKMNKECAEIKPLTPCFSTLQVECVTTHVQHGWVDFPFVLLQTNGTSVISVFSNVVCGQPEGKQIGASRTAARHRTTCNNCCSERNIRCRWVLLSNILQGLSLRVYHVGFRSGPTKSVYS